MGISPKKTLQGFSVAMLALVITACGGGSDDFVCLIIIIIMTHGIRRWMRRFFHLSLGDMIQNIIP